MNRQRVERLLGNILKGRAQNLAGPDKAGAGAHTGFRASNEAGTTTLYIYDQIGGWWDGVFAKDVAAALVGAGDVTVHINSGGGDIFEGAAIHNLLKNHAGKVTMRIDGVAASAASFIAMAGDMIIMEPNATMMVHEGSAICVGRAADMREAAELLEMLNQIIAGMYAARAGGTVDEWLTTMGGETWYDAAKALAAGLVDEVPPAKGQEPAVPAADAGDLLSAFALLVQPVAAAAPSQIQAEATPPAVEVVETPEADAVAAAAEPAADDIAPAVPIAPATAAPDTATAPAVVEPPADTTAAEATDIVPAAEDGSGFAAQLMEALA